MEASIHAETTEMSASQAVLNIAELLEAVLCHLDVSSLFLLLRVNRTFQATILNSVRLRRIMFLTQDPQSLANWNPSLMRMHPDLDISVSGARLINSLHELLLYLEVRERRGGRYSIASNPGRYNKSAACASTHLCAVPIGGVSLHMEISVGDGTYSRSAYLPGNAKLADVSRELDAAYWRIMTLRRQRETCDTWRTPRTWPGTTFCEFRFHTATPFPRTRSRLST